MGRIIHPLLRKLSPEIDEGSCIVPIHPLNQTIQHRTDMGMAMEHKSGTYLYRFCAGKQHFHHSIAGMYTG